MRIPSLEELRDRQWFYPTVWAIVLHILLAVLAAFIYLGGDLSAPDPTPAKFHLKSVDLKPIVSRKRGAMDVRADRNLAQPPGEPLQNALKALSQITGLSQVEKKTPVKPDREEKLEKTRSEKESSSSRDLDTILVETEEAQSSERVVVKQRSADEFYHERSVKSTNLKPLSGAALLEALKRPLVGSQLYTPKNVSIDPEEGMPGFTPTGKEAGLGSGGTSDTDYGEGVEESKGTVMKYESLDDFLDIAVFTYEDPRDGEKYFMIKIFAKKGAEGLRVMPKEILFTIDASLSISPDRLEEVKKGIRYCLQHLNKDDVFNIVAFKDKVSFFRPGSVAATPETIKEAENFVQSLTASQQTDVYQAFKQIVDLKPARRPSDIILISDGRPTHGVVDSRDVINSVTRANQKVRPVFAFSGGAKVNRYLLDFIAYQNRAWSQFIKRTGDIDKGLAEFYDKIRDPIFLDLRYRLNGVDESAVFPRSLPDFYKNAEFTLFGKYAGEDKFSMQLLGDVDGKTKELIFQRSLKEAKPGNEDIMRGYAFNRIYYLISRMTQKGDDPGTVAEIRALSERYGITTPYSQEMERVD